jgi:hypothetical protein
MRRKERRMKTIRAAVMMAVLVVSLAPTASAQTIDDLLATLKLMQAQTDRLQAAMNAHLVETKMRAVIDSTRVELGDVYVYGWAFRCGTTSLRSATLPLPARLDVLIDGLPNKAYFNTAPRPDVVLAGAAVCGAEGVPADAGVMMLVNLRAYPTGPHDLAFRLTDDVTGAVAYSNTVTVIR